ncbi:hypothetical protein AW736_07770 [Termitidicoccus mucosus]|uniref:Glycoside hydrolase family 5 domain-containing protein n=1 Tax=Termitidicoccus mucosus TaxID=1184151 RepID=A0A178IKR9_9BACT|nr:hypothetical protein AW736_07770 [Opitutaceae bacterium TSB47]
MPATAADDEHLWLKVKGTQIVTSAESDGGERLFIPAGIGYGRDVMIYPRHYPPGDERILQFCKERGLNTVRLAFYTLYFNSVENRPIDIQEHVQNHIDPVIAAARKQGMYVILDCHEFMSGTIDEDDAREDQHVPKWGEEKIQQWINAWKIVASRYKDEPHVLGYELLNEPHVTPTADLRDNYRRCIQAIREVDKRHIIILGNETWTHARSMERTWGDIATTIDAPHNNVVFAFHDYPDDNHPWLVEEYVTTFRDKHGVPVLCTEFGALNWKKSETVCRNFLAGMHMLFAKEGIGWMIWCLRTLEDHPRDSYNTVDETGLGPPIVFDSCPYSDLWPAVARVTASPMPLPKRPPFVVPDALPGQEIIMEANTDGYPSDLSYSWEVSSDGVSWSKISGDTELYKDTNTARLRIRGATALMSGYYYRYIAANPAMTVSGTATLTVKAPVLSAPAALVVDAITGELYVTDANQHTIYKITADASGISLFAGAIGQSGTLNASGTAARFNQIAGIDIDTQSGGLVVADTGNSTLRILNSAAAVNSLAGSPGLAGFTDGSGTNAFFRNPAAVVADNMGNIYVADTDNHVIRMVTPEGIVTTIAGTPQVSGTLDGSGTHAQFKNPAGIAFAGNTLYIADTGNHTIRFITPADDAHQVFTLAGQPGSHGSADGDMATAARFHSPRGLLVDGDTVYVADTGNSLIRKIEISAGKVATIAGYPGDDGDGDSGVMPGVPGFKDGQGNDAWLRHPEDIAIASDGTLYVADTGNAAIRKIAADNNATVSTLTPDMIELNPPTPPPPVDPPPSSGGSSGSGGGGGGVPSHWFFAIIIALVIIRARKPGKIFLP